MKTLATYTLALLALAGLAPFAWAQQDPAALVDSIYEKDIQRVQATPEKTDDLALAKQMLEAARAGNTDPAVVSALCKRVMDLTEGFPPGHETALGAAELAIKKDPASRPAFQARMIALLQKRYALSRGDERIRTRMTLFAMLTEAAEAAKSPEDALAYYRQALTITPSTSPQGKALQAKVKALQERDRIARMVKQWTMGLEIKDDPADRGKLILALLLDLDSPTLAAAQVKPSCDETLRTYVPLAAQPGPKLAASVCLELGEWFRSISGQAISEGGVALALNRSYNYFQQFIDRADPADPQLGKAKLALSAVEGQLKRMNQTPHRLWKGAAPTAGNDPAVPPAAPPTAANDATLPPPPASASKVGLVFAWSPQTRAILYPDSQGKVAQGVTLHERGKVDPQEARFEGGSLIAEEQVSRRLLDACRQSGQITIALSLAPATIDQDGPARIVSFSRDANNRDFTIGQIGADLVLRLRTKSSGANGMLSPELVIGKLHPGQWSHVVVSYQSGSLSVWTDGQKTLQSDKFEGDFSSWDLMALVLGDEWKDPRPWKGRLTNVRIYSRVMGQAEVRDLVPARAAGVSPVRGTGILPVRPTGVSPVESSEKDTTGRNDKKQGQDAPVTHGRDARATDGRAP